MIGNSSNFSIFVYILLVILAVIIFRQGYQFCVRVVKNPYSDSDGKATNLLTPVSTLEVRITLPSRIIYSSEAVRTKYDPSELVHNPNVKLGGGTLGPLHKVILNCGSIAVFRRIRKCLVKPTKLDSWIQFFSKIEGECVLPILFSCWYGEEAFLVYEYFCLGSLEELLHGREGIEYTPLNWGIRCYIARCASIALASVHSQVTKEGDALVCGVIKASNIMIQIDFSAVLSGYEAPYLIPSRSLIKRNPGRIAPELYDSGSMTVVFTQKSDVYSFGILLLELVTGKKPVVTDENGEVMLADYVKLMKKDGLRDLHDKKMQEVNENVISMVEIAELCLLKNPSERPSMDKVVEMIKQLLN